MTFWPKLIFIKPPKSSSIFLLIRKIHSASECEFRPGGEEKQSTPVKTVKEACKCICKLQKKNESQSFREGGRKTQRQ